LKKKTKARALTSSDFKIYYKKAAREYGNSISWKKYVDIIQWILEIESHLYGYLIFGRGIKEIQ
jgi:hypothetical protein